MVNATSRTKERSKSLKIWARQGLRQNGALLILLVLDKLKDTKYGTNKSVIHLLQLSCACVRWSGPVAVTLRTFFI